MGLDEGGWLDEAVGKRREARARGGRQGSVPGVWVEVAAEDGEVQVGQRAHVGDVGEHLASLDRRADAKSWAGPDVPVLRDHDTFARRVPDEDAAAKLRVDAVAGDDAVGRGHDGLDAGLDVDAGVQPDGAGRAGTQHGAVADAPLAAKAET